MLCHLSLKDFVIVEELAVEITDGLTVLTGETGAGKSILIDALQFILGSRADTSVIREGAKETNLTAIFEVSDKVAQSLKDADLMPDEDLLEKSVIVRRLIDVNGRSRAWINGVAVTNTQLKALGEKLLDIHGQNAHQSLLKPAGQLALLDEFGGYKKELAQTREAFEGWQTIIDKVRLAKDNAQKLADEAERLAWVHDELSAINPQEGEWEELNAEHKRLGNAHDILETISGAVESLLDSDESAVSRLAHHAQKLEALAECDSRLGDIAAQLAEAQSIAEDAMRELERYRDRTDLDENRFEEVDARVSLYFNAARKFHVMPEELFEKFTQTQEKLASLQTSLDLEALLQEEKAAEKIYRTAAKALSKKRKDCALALSEKVTDAMQTLSMKGGRFEVALHESAPAAIGLERAEFLVAGHAGVAPRALNKVASGGELSRISLAIAVITSSATPVDTLIFDEVDAGIGGATADVVGRLLRTLAHDRQVMCVTHLPQVAAFGHTHWHISKAENNGVTSSHLETLDRDMREKELARMLGGQIITEKTLANARELLDQAAQA